MPEQSTPTPIKREDIREGDRIRVRYEYVYGGKDTPEVELLLVNRPVALPTRAGWYESSNFLLSKGNAPYRLLSTGGWSLGRESLTEEYMRAYAHPLAPLRPEAEVVAEVLDAVREANVSKPFLPEQPYAIRLGSPDLDAIATKYGVTS